jgi:hypothetical protein
MMMTGMLTLDVRGGWNMFFQIINLNMDKVWKIYSQKRNILFFSRNGKLSFPACSAGGKGKTFSTYPAPEMPFIRD